MKYVVLNFLIRSPCSASDLHSIVQPCVYALGNHARTTACLPLKSASLYVLPSLACSVKSGAGSPTFSSLAPEAIAAKPSTASPSPNSPMCLICAPPQSRKLYIERAGRKESQ